LIRCPRGAVAISKEPLRVEADAADESVETVRRKNSERMHIPAEVSFPSQA
jgi:hypothetical protein